MRSKKKAFSWQGLVALIFLPLGIIGFLWAFIPPTSETITLQLQEIRVPVGDETFALLQESYKIVIETPKTVKAGSQFGYTFELQQSDLPVNITDQDVDINEYYQLNLMLEPAFENTTINPPGSVATAILPGQEPAMIWKMEPTDKETITGIFWATVDFVPIKDGVEPSSTALLARKLNIPVQTILGMNTDTITIFATVFCVTAIFLGLPQLPFFKGESDVKRKK